MKKMLFMSTLASIVLTGCVKNEVVELSTQLPKEISFGNPVMYNQTKSYDGEIKGTTYPNDENFVVFAVETDGNFKGWHGSNADNVVELFFPQNGVTVKKGSNDNYWHINESTVYHWPDETNHKLTFAAYSPARASEDGTITYNDTGLKITGFKVKDTPTSQYDLLYSPRTIDATTSPVPIAFKHALSSIRFRFVKPADGAYSIIVKKIEIFGEIINKADFNQDIAPNSATNTGTPIWNNKSIEGDNTYTLFNGTFEVPAATGTEITSISSFLPIPQQMTVNKKVRIVYATKQKETDASYSDDITVEKSFLEFITSGTSYTQSWEMGKRYVYHVHFGALKEIYFSPSITDWDEVSEAGAITL